jgi:hypothetical protein
LLFDIQVFRHGAFSAPASSSSRVPIFTTAHDTTSIALAAHAAEAAWKSENFCNSCQQNIKAVVNKFMAALHRACCACGATLMR